MYKKNYGFAENGFKEIFKNIKLLNSSIAISKKAIVHVVINEERLYRRLNFKE
jgi:hypothetical protein